MQISESLSRSCMCQERQPEPKPGKASTVAATNTPTSSSYLPQLISKLSTPPIAMTDLLDSMLDLMRRLPPANIEENVSMLVNLCPDYADDLLSSVDQPLQLRVDKATGREYLVCDYNRDGESYRYVGIFVLRYGWSILIVCMCCAYGWSVYLLLPRDIISVD